ncbi:MAG: Gldg family protein [Clostridia bacterium]|nr:Gldg family protein [Clostridia bacterium]
MNLFKKKSSEEILEATETVETAKVKTRRFINRAKMKYGSYALAISAIVIAVAVGVNVLFGVLADRVNLDIDISLKGENTLTEENIEFLKTVSVPVTLTVCASKESYINDLDYYTGQSFGVTESGSAYYEQTVRFLDLYTKYSDNISVEFIDLQNPESAALIQQYSDYGINYGDIIVSAKHMVDGKESVRDTVVGYDDLYYLYDQYAQYYGYSTGSYVVNGNYFEKAVSSAIRKVASEETIKVGVISTHCTPDNVTYFGNMLNLNNFELSDIKDPVISEISKDLSMLIIAAPTEDFAVSELEAIDTWLYNNGEKGKGLLFFASATSPEMPNLCSYLEEWGISVGSGILFDTNEQSHLPSDPMTMLYSAATEDNDVVKAVVEGTANYIVSSAVPLTAIIENDGTRSTHIPVKTYSEDVVVAPLGSGTSWQAPKDAVKEQMAGIIVSKEEEYVNNEPKVSYVVAFASVSFVSESISETYSAADNMYAALNAANLSVGADENEFSFYMKSFEAETYTVTAEASKAITYIFQWGIPVLLIICGIVVFVRRRSR